METQAPTGIDPAPEALRAVGQEYHRAIRDGDSVFTPGRHVWTVEVAQELVSAFVDQPDVSGRSFDAKLNDQLDGASDTALQLFAEIWYLNLAPLADYTPSTKRKLITDVLDRMSVPVSLPAPVEAALTEHAFNGGVAFKTRRPFQLALLIRLAVAVLGLPRDERESVLSDPRAWSKLLASVPDPNEPAQRRSLSWLLFPDYFLSVVSERHRSAIRKAFADRLAGTERDADEELFKIRESLAEQYGSGSFYAPPIVDGWDPGRTLSGAPVTPDSLQVRSEFKTPGYAIASAAIDLVPEGYWTTYSDVADVAGLIPGQVGEYLSNIDHPAGHRVIKIDGTTYSSEAREALEAEGVEFDERGAAHRSRWITREDLREQLDAQGLLPKVSKRAWLIRGSSVNGRDLVPTWRAEGWFSLAATNLRSVTAGMSREALKPIVDEDYAHASYAVKGEKLDEFHAFLTRMQAGHLVVTVDQGRLYVGTIAGEPRHQQSPLGDSNLVRDVEWTVGDGIDYGDLPGELAARLKVQRDVLDLTQQLDTIESLLEAAETETPVPISQPVVLPAATEELADELHVPRSWLQECIDLLNDRPQLIFYGPPGTGKTFIAQALARHVAGERVRLVQFHPSYSYEDFFEGYRPKEDGGFKLMPGPMRKIVDQAVENPREAFVLIIDEINRGNLAKVFGELYFLLEYRDQNVELLYADEDFSLPKNVFIIGTMNTADRSIALVDAAMRRRFAFLPLHPSEQPTRDVLRSWLDREGYPTRVADLLAELNRRIEDADFKIGPSYFMRAAVHQDGGLERTWRTSILPLLEEHHFGEYDAKQVAVRYGLDAVAAAVDKVPEAQDSQDAPADAD